MTTTHITAEMFTAEFTRSLVDNKLDEFRSKHRTADSYLLDNIQFIAGKEAVQQELVAVLEALKDNGALITLTLNTSDFSVDSLEDEKLKAFLKGMDLIENKSAGFARLEV